MSKPEWNEDTPKWANWLAQDVDGAWYWYEHKPQVMHARHEIDYSNGSGSRCQLASVHNAWFTTAEPRP